MKKEDRLLRAKRKKWRASRAKQRKDNILPIVRVDELGARSNGEEFDPSDFDLVSALIVVAIFAVALSIIFRQIKRHVEKSYDNNEAMAFYYRPDLGAGLHLLSRPVP